MHKSFSELTQREIRNMSREEFLAVSPFEKKSCYDCGHLYSVLSWWCGNEEAIKYRGTKRPGVIKCDFWKPNWNDIDKKYKIPENGYQYSFLEKIINWIKNR